MPHQKKPLSMGWVFAISLLIAAVAWAIFSPSASLTRPKTASTVSQRPANDRSNQLHHARPEPSREASGRLPIQKPRAGDAASIATQPATASENTPRLIAFDQSGASDAPARQLDPAAWGSDHTGQPLPEYMDSGECLFCHRADAGATWGQSKHNRTIRDAAPGEPAMQALQRHLGLKDRADEVQLILGDTRANRFLKRSTRYGKLHVLPAVATFGRTQRPRLAKTNDSQWDAKTFAANCAGCHCTAVDSKAQTFSSLSVDCFACHGDAPAEHANDPALMPLAKVRGDSPAVVTSICAQCHVRFGKSKSTGLPYPNNFVAGDNLFKDFQVDFALADDPGINPADRHVLDNIRDVVLYGRTDMTCLSCHDVHTDSTIRHRDLPDEKYCLHCHQADEPKTKHIFYEVHSDRCEY